MASRVIVARRRTSVAVCLSLALCTPWPAISDLTGQVLQPAAPDSGDAVAQILGAVLGSGSEEPRIDGVRVIEDSAEALVLEVTYRGLAKGSLRAELLDPGGDPLPGISASVRLAQTPAPAELRLTPPRATPEAPVRAGFVRFRATLGSAIGPPITPRYVLRRSWSGAEAGGGSGALPQVIRVEARPIGAAAQLGKGQGPAPMPPLQRLPKVSPTRVSSVSPLGPLSASAARRLSVTTVGSGTAGEAGGSAVTPEVSAGLATQLGPGRRLVTIERYPFGLNQKDKDLGAQGPGSDAIELVEAMRVDVDLDRDDILAVFPLVYRDKNLASGVYYYLPGRYRLAWEADDGYAMRFLYTAGVGDAAGDVLVAMRLDSGVDLTEVALARELLDGYAARHGLGTVRQLRALPLTAPPSVSLASDLQHQYRVPAEKVVVNAMSDSLAEIEVGFSVDPVTKENVQLALEEEVGLSGRVALSPYGEALAVQEVPLEVRLAEASTFGRFRWERDVAWRNETPYPIDLRYLHVMTLDGEVPVIYSWALEGERVPAGSSAEIDSTTIPVALDARATRQWLDYRVATDCDACDRKVIAAISGGVSAVTAREITFRTLSPLADTGAVEIVLFVRSRLFHPQNRELVEKPHILLDGDGRSYAVGPIYIDEGEESGRLFEYRLQVILPDGTVRSGEGWIASSELYQPIGRVQVEQAVGSLGGGGGGR